ncbi:protease synthase and sporulation negativeregulatory protein pai 1 [Lichtheimia corymbifera JMRC:FSU:9682]|uniref:Protease synthase and sporulation negativeregulatory protein pai 1 n=1 Tax=Lichtheimia corymbifera JMRC:FSU:9682 TaxID=1263082 RepID=A0A068S1R2_9FUNG|nr:protease synthase and sporulation negativeregulatory protein pai 1 [Lichtheimia corymbifera JMRC:FSU:9682]
MDTKIVKIDANYAKILSELGARLFTDTYAKVDTPEDLELYLNSTYRPDIQTKELNDPTVTAYMAFDQDSNQPVAFCQLRQTKHVYDFVGDPEDAIELQRLYVDKQWAGMGLGKRLLAECVALATKMGKKAMWLCVYEHNLDAIKFYEKQGFHKVGAHTFKVGNKLETDPIMLKSLI